MKQAKPAIPIFLAIVFLFSATIACNFDESEDETNLFYHYYSIQPESLLGELEAGNIDVFLPVTERPSPIPPDQQIPVPWTQVDYLGIANALYAFIWGDTLDGWQLNSMDFGLRCTEYEVGLQDGNFRFFKVVETGGRESRRELIINIYPRGKYVFITENEYYPKLVDWESIDLGQNQLSASDVLQIAENAGGEGKRLFVDNACDISIWLSPDYARYRGWVVHYYRESGTTTLFQVSIDPVTGEIR